MPDEPKTDSTPPAGSIPPTSSPPPTDTGDQPIFSDDPEAMPYMQQVPRPDMSHATSPWARRSFKCGIAAVLGAIVWVFTIGASLPDSCGSFRYAILAIGAVGGGIVPTMSAYALMCGIGGLFRIKEYHPRSRGMVALGLFFGLLGAFFTLGSNVFYYSGSRFYWSLYDVWL